uniref:Amino acid permease/ SLC12A domain-containing protein n=1 Tax=Gibberella zeae TaxID=5518 RepID=A0A4E9DL01_GIBZA
MSSCEASATHRNTSQTTDRPDGREDVEDQTDSQRQTTQNDRENTTQNQPGTRTKVDRKLTPIQLFMITVNGTLGAGLYVRSAQILELAGPVAVVCSFLGLGFLAWAVMQCIAELLCIWPVGGALPLFVMEFVDKELGYAVAIAYWFTYTVGFAALVAISASTVSYWMPGATFYIHIVVYTVLPFVLGAINVMKIGWYGYVEVVFGVIKLSMSYTDWLHPDIYDKGAAPDFVSALMLVSSTASELCGKIPKWGSNPLTNSRMTIPIATFAYTGVEIIAASIIEARWDTVPSNGQDGQSANNAENAQNLQDDPPTQDDSNRTPRPDQGNDIGEDRNKYQKESAITIIKATAVVVPIFIGIAYTITGLLIALGLSRDDPGLPRLSWIESTTSTVSSTNIATSTATSTATEPSGERFKSIPSPLVLIAKKARIDYLEHIFNAFILFTALTCANTNLYVASRTLYGITRNIIAPSGVSKLISRLGETDRNNVPQLALWSSVIASIWIPLIEIPGGFKTNTSFGWAVGILVHSGSVSVIIVWACVCLAYIRYCSCIENNENKVALQQAELYPLATLQRQPQDQSQNQPEDHPYRNYFQPLLAWIALGLCICILIIFNGAFLWKKFHLVPLLTGYLPIFVFILIWIGLKIWKTDMRLWKTLDKKAVLESVKKLNGLRDTSLAPSEAATTAVNTNGSMNNQDLPSNLPQSAGNIHHRR